MSPGLALKGSAIPSGSSRGNPVSALVFRLPPETLEGIFAHVRYNDLLNLARTCRSFHELAMAQLYRRVSYVFGSSGPSQRQSLGQFISMLETLATSEYNYAQFIRQIALERSSANDTLRGEFRGSGVDYGYACERLLNTLLLIVLKKVGGLESFSWDIYIELRMPVFEALSKMPTLQNLHLRLPVEPEPKHGSFSSFNNAFSAPLTAAPPPPPGVPQPMDITGIVPSSTQVNQIHSYHNNVPHHHHHHYSSFSPQPMIPVVPNSTKLPHASKGSTGSMHKKRGFSLISGLKRLAVLDIDNVECIAELAQSVHSNASSIRSIKFSLSERLASKARGKSGAEFSDSDSVSEADDWGVSNAHIPPPPHATVFQSPPVLGASSASTSNAPDVRRARAAQEAFLAQIFGVEASASQVHTDQALEETILTGKQKTQKDAKPASKDNETTIFFDTLRRAVHQFSASAIEGSLSQNDKTWEMVDAAAARYFNGLAASADQAQNATTLTSGSSFQIPGQETRKDCFRFNIPLSSSSNSQHIADSGTSIAAEKKHVLSDAPAASSISADKRADDYLSDIVDMEHPDDLEGAGEDQEFLDISKDGGSDATAIPASEKQPHKQRRKKSKVSKGKKALREIKNEARSRDIDSKPKWESLEDYIRNTHGISLESLSLYLIPVKPAVLCRAVDVFSLKHLSLLNVGPQRTLWAMLEKLHQTRPLQLSSIHTDNVIPSFLSFANRLDRITELFMFECSRRGNVESFATKTTVGIDEIRRSILVKHAGNLQRLVIRNDEDSTWILTAQEVRQLALQGSKLIELGVSMNSASYHVFLQNIGCFSTLVALQVFYHHGDRCNTMMRELRNCIIDHISHFRNNRLEYVSMGFAGQLPVYNHVMRITSKRPSRDTDVLTSLAPYGVGTSFLEKRKASAPSTAAASTSTSSPWLQSPEDSDGVIDPDRVGARISVKHIKMRDVVGIKIFTMEVLGVKL